MTCIAAVKHKKRIVIGADSAGIALGNLGLQLRSDVKVFTRKSENGRLWGFGFTSSFRMGQLLRYKLELPEVPPKEDLLEFMVTRFIESLRKCLRDGGYAKKEHEVEEGGNFIVAFGDELFEIGSDFQVAQAAHPFLAVGCGEQIALGALVTSLNVAPVDKAEAHVERALLAAERFSAGVRAPFHLVVVE